MVTTADALLSGQKVHKPIIGLDLLGGDIPPERLLKDLLPFIEGLPLAIFGLDKDLEAFSKLDHSLDAEFIPVGDVVALKEDPLAAVRKKKESSVNIGMRLLKEGRIQAYVGIGNTGAMLASAKIHLNPLPHKPRPALLAMLPTQKNPVAVLDVGANLALKPDQMLQLAKMGIAFQKTRGVKSPKVGLLNIGSEEIKGRKDVREAYKKLKNHLPDHFFGNIEGRDVFKGTIDVLVTDGFTGNIFLKTAEGMSHYILDKVASFLPKDESVTSHLDTDTYPGALLCGVDGIVMKCHSYASAQPIAYALSATQQLIENNLIDHLHTQLR